MTNLLLIVIIILLYIVADSIHDKLEEILKVLKKEHDSK
jgi:hypothetical protein